jgi:hypothetical protein
MNVSGIAAVMAQVLKVWLSLMCKMLISIHVKHRVEQVEVQYEEKCVAEGIQKMAALPPLEASPFSTASRPVSFKLPRTASVKDKELHHSGRLAMASVVKMRVKAKAWRGPGPSGSPVVLPQDDEAEFDWGGTKGDDDPPPPPPTGGHAPQLLATLSSEGALDGTDHMHIIPRPLSSICSSVHGLTLAPVSLMCSGQLQSSGAPPCLTL